MLNRRQIREWFKKALLARSAVVGLVYDSRDVIVEDEPDSFANFYIESGKVEDDSNLGRELYYIDFSIVVNVKNGSDDDLDNVEVEIGNAISNYVRLSPPNFSFYRTGFHYSGDPTDTYNRLVLEYQIITH